MKAIIIGSSGQDGFYLRELLEKKGVSLYCISRSSGDCKGDISEYAFISKEISQFRPDYIFNFAAESTTRHDALFDNHLSISTGTFNLLESVRLYCPDTKVFLSGSAMQFENKGLPINEKTPFEALSPYSVSRIHSVYAARYYREKFGLQIFVGYFFNHDSPLRSERHVNQKIVQAVKRIAAGSDEKIELGDISVKKEFSYAADIVEAVWILVNQHKIYEAVIGSGIAYSIEEWIAYCFDKIGKNWQDYVILRKDFTSEYQILISDPSVIRSLGWKPNVGFSELANKMLDDKSKYSN